MKDHPPDFCELKIHEINYFTFLISAAVFGFNCNMIIEVSVEYGLAEDGQLHANIWARQNCAPVKHYVHSATISPCDDPATGIVESLNKDADFQDAMAAYICEAAKHRCD